jgi:hypothetical protein
MMNVDPYLRKFSCAEENRTCTNGNLSGTYENSRCNIEEPPTPITCKNITIPSAGDMTTSFTSIGSGYYKLTFGTWSDNYWGSGQYDRSMNFVVDDLSQIESFVLNHAAFDDWIWVKINDVTVYIGPYSNYGITSIELSGKHVMTNVTTYNGELGKSWSYNNLNINLKPYLRAGNNTVWTRTIVQGGGESYIDMRIKRTCTDANEGGPTDPLPPVIDCQNTSEGKTGLGVNQDFCP